MALGRKTGGATRKGIPNRATSDMRRAMAYVMEGHIKKLERWLNEVAEGKTESVKGRDGKVIRYEDGTPQTRWLRPPDPGQAFKLLIEMAEFHIPKLQRVEHTALGAAKGEALMTVLFVASAPAIDQAPVAQVAQKPAP